MSNDDSDSVSQEWFAVAKPLGPEWQIPETLIALETAERYLEIAKDAEVKEDWLEVAERWIRAASETLSVYINEDGNPFNFSHLTEALNESISRYKTLGGDAFPDSGETEVVLVPSIYPQLEIIST